MMLASSRPMWTPSASTAMASSGSSLTMYRPPRAAMSRASACACATRPAGTRLLRYWTLVAPPSSAADTLATSACVSSHSGVSAYRPCMRAARARRSDNGSVAAACIGRAAAVGNLHVGVTLLLARPEQAVGDPLPHAGAIRLLQRVPGVILRLAHRVADVEPVREHRGNRRGERATGAVIRLGEPRPRVGAHDTAPAVQGVDHLRR